MRAVSLQLPTGGDFAANLSTLLAAYGRHRDAAFVAAPEVYLTGFSYDRFEEAAAFSLHATQTLFDAVGDTPLLLTMIEKRDDAFYNVAKVFHQGQVVHEQRKHQLFLLGNEHDYFAPGPEEEIRLFDLNGVKAGILICFELRFTDLWKRLEGAEIIFVPAMWGKLRKSHYETLCRALAIANRCFVVACDSPNDDMAAGSAVITPWGEVTQDDEATEIVAPIDLREIKKMKRAIPYP